jgi:hypothetical protein
LKIQNESWIDVAEWMRYIISYIYKATVFNILAPFFMLFTFIVVKILKHLILDDFDEIERVGLSMSM